MVRGRAPRRRWGSSRRAAHRIVDIPRCRVHHPLHQRGGGRAAPRIRATATGPTPSGPHAGELRAVQIVVERATGPRRWCSSPNTEEPATRRDRSRALAGATSARPPGPVLERQPRANQRDPGRHGETSPATDAARVGRRRDVFFPPAPSGRAILPLVERIASASHDWCRRGRASSSSTPAAARSASASLARAGRVVFVESAPDACAGLALGIAARPAGGARASRSMVAGPRGGARARSPRPSRDRRPAAARPRRGAPRRALAAPPPRSSPLSCDLDVLPARVARGSRRAGFASLGSRPTSLFPNTEHVETLARFERPLSYPRPPTCQEPPHARAPALRSTRSPTGSRSRTSSRATRSRSTRRTGTSSTPASRPTRTSTTPRPAARRASTPRCGSGSR